ncbi:unnamed protein product [marine sediment metagenome]|uniref:Uncharacterized protein n=1 Tax=marine sediment metagenome TaxID=412755 RepID=X0W0N8_9ZZZZ
MLKLKGTIHEEGKHWLIELPSIEIMTQGTSKSDAFLMLNDCMATLLDEPVKYGVIPIDAGNFKISFPQTSNIVRLVFDRLRQSSLCHNAKERAEQEKS